ncbi:serpin B3 [Tribolium castaneum]|uniref:Serpin peptidase inhibitor 31 n=1 Tax=Tribolium castaneum TaxID=7070 RepID=D6WWV2_TRICA|nr:PREDICTED: serpin B3 [Tribolium castaneum]EFA09277.1 serpin peptidase inhibitor 31 [Tribolium castaneum]|eukprot:XP_972482.1 PREDICTED: serpin B3 [Tribolium castaneum]
MKLAAVLSLVILTQGEEFSQANYLFTSDVYKECVKNEGGNLLVSPLSVEIVLALAQCGARDETAREIQTALHLASSDQKTAFKSVISGLKGGEHYSLHTANKIYLHDNFSIRDDFKTIATEMFQSEVENIDFSKTEAAGIINKWVEDQTNQKIKNLVRPESLQNSPSVLVNALYFKARWASKNFLKYPYLTKIFSKTATDQIESEFMIDIGGSYQLHEDKELGARFLKAPFKGQDAHMVFVLPDAVDGLGRLEEQADKIFREHSFQPVIINVELPRFKIESTVNFKSILQKLGVRKAFMNGEADFSGIAGKKGELVVGQVTQKSYIDVNKDGVEAAAATNLVFTLSGPPRTTKEFKANHPFLFYIQAKGVVLFAGRVVDPKY